jgi:cytoskeletal protein RodZ
MGRRRVIQGRRRNAGPARFVVLMLVVFAVALLLGFFLGRIGSSGEETAPPTPPARSGTVQKTVPAPEKTIEKTVSAPEKSAPESTATPSASASP